MPITVPDTQHSVGWQNCVAVLLTWELRSHSFPGPLPWNASQGPCPSSTSPHLICTDSPKSCLAPAHLPHGMAMRWRAGGALQTRGHPSQQELCANTCHSYSFCCPWLLLLLFGVYANSDQDPGYQHLSIKKCPMMLIPSLGFSSKPTSVRALWERTFSCRVTWLLALPLFPRSNSSEKTEPAFVLSQEWKNCFGNKIQF